MYKRELDDKIAKNMFPKSLMLCGDFRYHIQTYSNQIGAHLASADETLCFYFDDYDYEAAKAHIMQPSLFGNTTLLVIKSDKNLPKNELSTLIEICFKNANSYFLYEYYGDDFKSQSHHFLAAKKADFVRFFTPTPAESIMILKSEASKLGLKISQNALQHLLFALDGEVELALPELTKFSILDREIESKEIDEIVHPLAKIKLERFIAQLLGKKDITQTLMRLQESAEDEILILAAVQGFVAQLFMFYAYIKLNGTIDSREILGYKLPPAIEKERAELSIRFGEKTYLQMLKTLAEGELLLKSATHADKSALLYSTLIKLQSLL